MNILQECEDALSVVIPLARTGNAATAEAFDDILGYLDKLSEPAALEMAAVAHFGAATLEARRGRQREARGRLQQAVALLDRVKAPGDRLFVLDAVADALIELGENRRALAYCNQAVARSRGADGALGARLWRAGRCHRRVGYNDAAVALLRQAVPRLRRGGLWQLLRHALLDLGGAGIKCAPQDAMEALREAASLFEAEGDLVNSGVAWLNLGVTCAQAGRLDEALAAYEKTRALREANPATTQTQRGNLHNNLAGVYRRRRDFARARAEVGQALSMLKSIGGEYYAHALATLGEICLDEGEAANALTHFNEARERIERIPGANIEQLATKLEYEVKALAALGRAGEAAALQARAATLRAETAPPAPTIPVAVPKPMDDDAACVIVELDGVSLPDEVYAQCDLGELERRLEDRLAETRAGKWDGHERGPQTVRIFLYGADADALLEAIRPVLHAYPLCQGAVIELRQDARFERFPLAPTRH